MQRLRGTLIFVNSTFDLSVASLLATVLCNTYMTEPACRKDSIVCKKRRRIGRTGSCFAPVCKKLQHEDFGPQHIDASTIENVHRPAEREREGNEIILVVFQICSFPLRCRLVKGPPVETAGQLCSSCLAPKRPLCMIASCR